MKPRLWLLMALVAVCLTGCVSKGLTDYDDIAALVTGNQELLEEYIRNGDFSSPPGIDGVLDIEECPGDAVHFNCGATGLGNSGTYYGFYYSYNGGPSDGWLAIDNFTQSGDGYFWRFLDNEYHTLPISGNFWYYSTKQ